MKTFIKQLSAVLILTAFVSAYSNANATGLDTPANEYTEVSLYLEDWMTDETIWNNPSFIFSCLVPETESTLEIENWMIDSENWK